MPRSALPQNYNKVKPTVMEDFSDISAWTSPTNCIIQEDLTNVYTGTKSVKLTTTSMASANGTTDKTVNINLSSLASKKIYMKFYHHTDPYVTTGQVAFYFGSVAWSKYFWVNVPSSKLAPGWNYLAITPDMCTYVGGESQTWNTTITKMRVGVTPATNQTAIVSFDGIYYNGEGIPKVLFTFDDGWATAYTNAFPYMQSKGLRGTIYTVPTYLGLNYMMTSAQIDETHNAGWCIANHTIDHSYYTTNGLTPSQYKDKVKQCIDWIVARGYRGAYHIAYPKGEYDSAVIQEMKNLGMKTARTTHTSQQHTYILDDAYQLNVVPLSSSVSLTTAKDAVDTAIKTGTTVIFMLHQIPVDDTAGTTDAQPNIAFSQSKFQGLVDYVKARGVDVPTIDEWYEGLTNPRYRSIPLNRALI